MAAECSGVNPNVQVTYGKDNRHVHYFGAALLHLGVRIPLGPAVVAVPNTIPPATVVETILGFAAVANLAAWMRAKRSSTRITLGIHLSLLAGVSLGMVSLFFRVGPRPARIGTCITSCSPG